MDKTLGALLRGEARALPRRVDRDLRRGPAAHVRGDRASGRAVRAPRPSSHRHRRGCAAWSRATPASTSWRSTSCSRDMIARARELGLRTHGAPRAPPRRVRDPAGGALGRVSSTARASGTRCEARTGERGGRRGAGARLGARGEASRTRAQDGEGAEEAARDRADAPRLPAARRREDDRRRRGASREDGDQRARSAPGARSRGAAARRCTTSSARGAPRRRDAGPHIVFNLLEEFQGSVLFDHHVVAFLELIELKYTGCDPRGLVLARDKALSKSDRRVSPHPRAALRRDQGQQGARARRGCLAYPLIVKSSVPPRRRSASRETSLVRDDEHLAERVTLHPRAARHRRDRRGVHRWTARSTSPCSATSACTALPPSELADPEASRPASS